MRAYQFLIESFLGRNKSKIYNILLDAAESGPFDGGCVIMAEALQKKHGGDIVVLVGYMQPGGNEVAQHAAVKLNNILVDADGAFEVDEFIRRFERNELVSTGGKITSIRGIQAGDLPDAPRDPQAAEEISGLLR